MFSQENDVLPLLPSGRCRRRAEPSRPSEAQAAYLVGGGGGCGAGVVVDGDGVGDRGGGSGLSRVVVEACAAWS